MSRETILFCILGVFPICAFSVYFTDDFLSKRANRAQIAKVESLAKEEEEHSASTQSVKKREDLEKEKTLERVVAAKLSEISEVEVKIFTAEGELVRYKENRQQIITDLEDLKKKIEPIIANAKKDSLKLTADASDADSKEE